MGPLARQGDFYVPEVRRAERRLSEEDEVHSDSDVSGRSTDNNGGVQAESKARRENKLAVRCAGKWTWHFIRIDIAERLLKGQLAPN